jgi:hypothetical protein
MNDKPLHPVMRLSVSGVLSVLSVCVFPAVGRDERWLIGVAGVAASAFVLLIPVLVRGKTWQKMIAGILLFLPSWTLVMVAAVVSSYQ